MQHPLKDYVFLTAEQVEAFDLKEIANWKDKGYFLEVDLSFPPEVQDMTHDLVLAPEKMNLTYKDLSPYARELHDKCYPSQKGRHKSTKLMATFKPRKNYVLHGENLKFYLSMGVKLDKIHRILSFTQRPFIATFIWKCTKLRSEATSEITKQVFKLFCNSNFGKFIETPTRYLSARFIFNEKQLQRAVREPYYQGVRKISDIMSVAIYKPQSICFDKATPVGVSILELSKLICYKFFYEVLVKKYGRDNLNLIFSDTGKTTQIRDIKKKKTAAKTLLIFQILSCWRSKLRTLSRTLRISKNALTPATTQQIIHSTAMNGLTTSSSSKMKPKAALLLALLG